MQACAVAIDNFHIRFINRRRICVYCKRIAYLIAFVYACLLVIAWNKIREKPRDLIYDDAEPVTLLPERKRRFRGRPTPPITVYNATILLWTTYYGNRDIISHIRNDSPVPSWCRITFDRRLHDKADAVVFHGLTEDLIPEDIPKQRKPTDVWVYFVLESPAYYDQNLTFLNQLSFNRTMTYRTDSDYYAPYGIVAKLENADGGHVITDTQLDRRKGLVVWMSSHCQTQSAREDLIEQLSKVIPVTMYGECGDQKCDRNDELGCYGKLADEFKFMLSFENSLCPHYITEKFTNALHAGIVPVVYGAGDYTAIMPYPRSYIDIRDFKSPEWLGAYLLDLNKNLTAYKQYLAWMKHYVVRPQQGFSGFRRLCEAIRTKQHLRHKTVNVGNLWNPNNCKEGPQMVQLT